MKPIAAMMAVVEAARLSPMTCDCAILGHNRHWPGCAFGGAIDALDASSDEQPRAWWCDRQPCLMPYNARGVYRANPAFFDLPAIHEQVCKGRLHPLYAGPEEKP